MAKRDDDENPLANVECYDLAEELADRMQLSPKNRAKFLHECMTRSGYEPVQTRESYARASRDDEREENGRWGFGNRAGKRPASRRRQDDDDSF
jgi:hypothetical protein